MGPSVKFVSTIIDAFPNQKKGGLFFGKKEKGGEMGKRLGHTSEMVRNDHRGAP